MNRIYIILLILYAVLQSSCTESFEIETIDFENVLVVESTITSEMKTQLVKLSRTSPLNEPGGVKEHNAVVKVVSSGGATYNFIEDGTTGDYYSNQMFQAQPDVAYTLEVSTQSGENYISTGVVLPQAVEMDQVYAELDTKGGKQGVSVFVDTQDLTGNAKYFRYEYEETYKIVTPYVATLSAEVVNYNPSTDTYEIVTSQRKPEPVCYSTDYSTGIIQTATADLTDNRVFHFPVRFIDEDNPIFRERYSILVKQYTQSIEAYTFYNIINELGNVESLLSQGQPGYVAGNMTSVENANKKVLGFFEVSPVAYKRIYFSNDDFGLDQPPYFVDCNRSSLNYNNPLEDRDILYQLLVNFNYQVLEENHPIYVVVQAECSVCTSFSSNVKPDFWID